MSEQSKSAPASQDLLEKEYHEIGIEAIAAACCVKRSHQQKKHADYDPHVEDY
ncbi:hypothetical protein SAMN04515647_2824 [Cohaesibacter sp. ES.047]|nr:hypothetical protein SAMN04515647_2824 [Cohaesibacter sp. ES.047]